MAWHAIWRSINSDAVLRSVSAATREAAVKFAKGNPPVSKGRLYVVSPRGKEEKVK